MKNKRSFSWRRILLSCSFITLFPVIFFGFTTWSWMWRNVGLREWETCDRSFQAASKGTFWDRGEWHHYVDFTVDVDTPEAYHWRVVEAPMPSAVYRKYSDENTVRATYRWPGDWWDPFPVSSWELCLVN